MMKNNNKKRAFTILELLISMFLVALLTGPILNTFQVSERLSRRNYKSFASQNLAKEMMNEIAKKSFEDPYQSSTVNVNLKPGPTHEEYIPDSTAPKIANGTDETTNIPRLFNETIVNRSKYYNDIDDYDGYNSDEALLPTLAGGNEYLINGENPYANLRIKVSVKSGATGALPPQEVLAGGAALGNAPEALAITPDGKHAAVLNSGDKTLSMINLQTGYEADCGPNGAGLASLSGTPCTAGVDRIPLSTLQTPPGGIVYNMGPPSKIILGPAGDRFYILHKADILDPDNHSGVSTIDMNSNNTPEVSFHKVFDTSLVSRDLLSNSINSIAVDKDGIVYAATNGGGLSKSSDNGETWKLQKLLLADGKIADTVYCLAAVKQGYGAGSAKYVYAGGKGGLWISKDNGPWDRVNTAGSDNITAIAADDNGYIAAGSGNGAIYASREYDKNFINRNGPALTRINTLAIDNSYRLWAGNGTGQFYSENIFNSASYSWAQYMPPGATAAVKVNTIHIDRSQTFPAPFTKVLDRDTNLKPGLPCAPSMLINEAGIHIFYLDNAGATGATDTTLAAARLWYVNSPDLGKTWNAPVRISHTVNDGNNEWAHSGVIDKNGFIHAVWNCYTGTGGTGWQMFYQRSEDGGKTWLSSDICVGNADHSLELDNLGHNTTADAVKLAAGKFTRVAISSKNCVYAAFSDNNFFNLRYSNDGGKTWPLSNTARYPSPGQIESITVIEPLGRLMFTFKSGGGRKMYFSDLDGNNFQINMGFNIASAIESAPPAFNEEYKFLYFSLNLSENSSSLGNSLSNIFQSASNYPYSSFSANNIQRNLSSEYPLHVKEIYPPSFIQRDLYLFFMSAHNNNAIFLRKSDSSGNNYYPSIFVDNKNGDFDFLTTAKYNGQLYFLKKSSDSSPRSNFYISSLPPEVLFTGCNKYIYSSNANGFLSPNINSYNFPDEDILCFTGDNDGNFLYGTSNGAYLRNINKPNLQYWAPSNNSWSAEPASYPPDYSGFKWRHFFNGVRITAVKMEKNGVWWVGTANKGIFRSNDSGENWTRIEAILSNINYINYIGKGSAEKINKLAFSSLRYNLKNPEDLNSVIPEILFSIYNLSHNSIESTAVVTQGQFNNIVSVNTNSFDNSKLFTYNGLDNKIYIRKPDRTYVTDVSSFVQGVASGANYQNDSYDRLTGIPVDPDDTIETLAGRKYFNNAAGNYLDYSSLTLPDGFLYNFGDHIGVLMLKLSGASKILGQYYEGRSGAAGNLAYCINRVEHSSLGYSLVRTAVKSPPEIIDASSKLNSNINNAFAAPDNKTVFLTNYTDGKVYSVSDINDTASIQINEYSVGITNPLKVIFSPKNIIGEFKTYIVSRTNIFDLKGNKLISDISGIDISDAAVDDNGEIYFTDRTAKKIYRCVSSAEKSVYVTVKESDEGTAGSMPPLTLARKFYNWQAANELRRGVSSNRNYLKYDYIYTSQKYPSGISGAETVTWEPKSRGAVNTLNLYIIDSVLEVNGTLEILAGTVVKFATADKTANDTNWSGKANSCIKAGPSGKLLISGGLKESERVLFTSLDDQALAPSVYSAADLSYNSPDGLANPQLLRVKSGVTEPSCGVKYGDWGRSDGTAANSFGGLHMADPANSIINNLHLKYGLIYTRSIYPNNIVPPNFNTTAGINSWERTNVFVVNDTLEIGAQTRLDIKQGAIIKFHSNTGISFKNTNPDNYPWYSIIADGSPSSFINMAHSSYANITEEGAAGPGPEGATPDDGSDGNWYAVFAKGRPDSATLRHIKFRSNAKYYLHLKGAEFKFSNCIFGNETSAANSFTILLSNYDTSDFYLSKFRSQENTFSLYASVNSFLSNSFAYNSSSPNSADSIISASSNSVLLMKDNLFSHQGNSNIALSRINLTATGYFSRNKFSGNTAGPGSNFGASCEIYVNSTPSRPAWPVVENNLFENCRCALNISGSGYDTTSAILEGTISNNSFANCGAILRTDISSAGDNFPQSPSNAAVDRDNNIYLTDTAKNCVYKYTPNGRLLLAFGKPGTGDGQFDAPVGIAVNDTGEIYVVDQGNKRIQKFDAAGNFILKFGQ